MGEAHIQVPTATEHCTFLEVAIYVPYGNPKYGLAVPFGCSRYLTQSFYALILPGPEYCALTSQEETRIDRSRDRRVTNYLRVEYILGQLMPFEMLVSQATGIVQYVSHS